jgi:hypothetical protein
VPLHIWRRSRQCSDLTLEDNRSACAAVLGLRKELAAAEAAERLEAQLVVGRAELATAPMAGPVADPQAGALARLVGLDEVAVRTGIALLLAGLIEAGSALGFTLVSVATGRNPPPTRPPRQPPTFNATHRVGAPSHSPMAIPGDNAERRPATGVRWPVSRRADAATVHAEWQHHLLDQRLPLRRLQVLLLQTRNGASWSCAGFRSG